jgi:hypothetical protein
MIPLLKDSVPVSEELDPDRNAQSFLRPVFILQCLSEPKNQAFGWLGAGQQQQQFRDSLGHPTGKEPGGRNS